MDDDKNLLAEITELSSCLPAPVETSLLKALTNLLGGLTAIPAAWAKRPAQAISDVTQARSAVAGILAKGVAEEALKDPAVMQAAAEIYLPTAIRKGRNKVNVAQMAIEHVAELANSGEQSAAPNDDWMNFFTRFAEDASSEQMQDLFARILAGEVTRPGSFSLATIRSIAEMDKSTAEDFSLVWAKSVGTAVDYSPEFQLGEWYVRWQRLAEVGLMAPTMTKQFLPPYNPVFDGNALWGPMSADGVYLLVEFPKNCAAAWSHIDFTRIGRELGGLLPRPDYVANIRSAGRSLSRQGVSKVVLQSANRPPEIIMSENAN